MPSPLLFFTVRSYLKRQQKAAIRKAIGRGFDISIESNIAEVQKQLDVFQRKAIPRVIVRSLNKTGTTVAAQARKLIKEDTALPVSFIKRKLQIRKAKRNHHVYSIDGLRGTTNLIEWVTPGQRNTMYARKANRRGVRSKAWGKPKVYSGTFIGRGKSSGKLLVFKRDSSKGSGVAGVYGPSVRSAFAKRLKELSFVAKKRFGVVFKHEMDFELSKLK